MFSTTIDKENLRSSDGDGMTSKEASCKGASSTAKRGDKGRTFGRILDNAISELREETDAKLAMKHQMLEADRFIQQLSDEAKRQIEDRKYAEGLNEDKFVTATPIVEAKYAEPKDVSECRSGANWEGKEVVAEAKSVVRRQASYDLDEKYDEKYCDGDCETEIEFTREDNEQCYSEDELIAADLHRLELRDIHKNNIRLHFDGDFANYLSKHPDVDDATAYQLYVHEKWEKIEMNVDDIKGGICISILLPELINVNVNVCGRFSLHLIASRRKFCDEDLGAATYRAEYSFEGATTYITQRTIEHEYESSSGVLFIFIDHMKLVRDDSSEDESVNKSGKKSDNVTNKTTTIADKNSIDSNGSFLFKISKGINKFLSMRRSSSMKEDGIKERI